MNVKRIALALLIAGAAAAVGYGLYSLGQRQGATMAVSSTAQAGSGPPANGVGAVDPGTGRRVLYWHDPMVPGHKFDKPGKSPFMDMQLVPMYADEAGSAGQISIDPRLQQNLGIRTADVMRAGIAQAIDAVGNVAYNERDVTVVQARSNGFVERLYVRAPFDPVRKGQRLAELYVPDWVAAQEEYLAVRRMAGPGTEAMADGARQRMLLAGMTEAQVRQVVASGKVAARLTLIAPASGVVTELTVREGMTVAAGAPLFRINGLDTVWVHAELPEAVSSQVGAGDPVEVRAPGLPGAVFKGKIGAILPDVDPATRTLKARVEVANPGSRLVPGMFANIVFAPLARPGVLVVPTEAIIRTGRRAVVIVAQEKGQFGPVEVETGTEVNGLTEIRKGLETGQKIVVSGQFLVDSESSLKGTLDRMGHPVPAATDGSNAGKAAQSALHKGTGKVEEIGKDDVTLSHGPVPSLKWPPMTMGFLLPEGGMPAGVKVGDTVSFEFRETPDGEYALTGIVRADGSHAGAGR